MKKSVLISILMLVTIFSGCSRQPKEVKELAVNNAITSTAEPIIEAVVNNEEVAPSEKIVISEETIKENADRNTQDISDAATSSVAGKIIVVDAGHGINSYNKQEPIAPNSSETKIAFATGTSGANQTEEQLVLAVSLKLQEALEAKGAIVHMTRTTHNSDMTNVDRAEFANELNADISVKIHADGNNNSSVHGVSVLVPGNQYISDSDVLNKSRAAGEHILSEFVKSTGAKNRGISVRNDLTGFNWTKVPIVLVEMGFMTNPDEDKLMGTEDYQNKMIGGIIAGLEFYFEEN